MHPDHAESTQVCRTPALSITKERKKATYALCTLWRESESWPAPSVDAITDTISRLMMPHVSHAIQNEKKNSKAGGGDEQAKKENVEGATVSTWL